MAPMLGKNVCSIACRSQMMHCNESGSNHASNKVERQYVVSFLKPCIWKSSTVNHTLIVSKYIADFIDWHTQVSKRVSQVNNLFNARSSSNEFRSICCSLRCSLLFGVPHDWCLLAKWTHPVTALPDSTSCIRFASK